MTPPALLKPVTGDEVEALQSQMIVVRAALDKNERRTAELGDGMTALQDTIKKSDGKTDELLAIFAQIKGFVEVAKKFGAFCFWLTKVAAAVALIWGLWKFGILEAVRQGSGK